MPGPAPAPTLRAMATTTLGPLTARRGGRPRVVVAGGGFAAAEAVLALRALAGDRVAIELVAPHGTLDLRPLAVRRPFAQAPAPPSPPASLAVLCRETDADLRRGAVGAVDVPGGTVRLDTGALVDFDALVLAVGARRTPAVRGAPTFERTAGVVEVQRLLAQARGGAVRRVAFVVPGGVTWALPMYELALQAAHALRDVPGGRPGLVVVTPEPAPLAAFGADAAERVAETLAAHDVEVVTGVAAERFARGRVEGPGGVVRADLAVALPVVRGPELPGVPLDPSGFLPTDEFGLVAGTDRVYAAGDATSHPVKQGGLATQQADAAAAQLALRVGAPVVPEPFRPVLRGLLLTGGPPLHLLGGGEGVASEQPLWPPVGKVVGRYLSPWLQRHGVDLGEERPAPSGRAAAGIP